MICKNCGAQLDEGSRFCIGCGQPVVAGNVNVTPAANIPPQRPAKSRKKTIALIAAIVVVLGTVGGVILYFNSNYYFFKDSRAGEAFYEAGDYGNAIKYFIKVIADEKKPPAFRILTYNHLCDSFAKMGDYENALSYIEKGLTFASQHGLDDRVHTSKLTELRDTITGNSGAINPGSRDAITGNSNTINPNSMDPLALFENYYSLADASFNEKNVDNFLYYCSEAIKVAAENNLDDPRLVECYRACGIIYCDKEMFEEAEFALSMALYMETDNGIYLQNASEQTLLYLGIACYMIGDYDNAKSAWDCLLLYYPNNPYVRDNLKLLQ